MTKRILIVLLCLVCVGAFLRLYKLGENPPGLTWDEAALGYNAYSLLKTGADEYGVKLPLTLQSFGDYKPALYAYATIPSVAVFGLTEFAVRLPNAFFGVIAIVLAFFIVRKITEKDSLGILAAGVLTFSPWHIHFSRGAWEADMALTIILLGLWLFLKGLEKPLYMIPSVVAFVLSLYTYQSSRLFVPLLGGGLLLLYWKEIYPLKKEHLIALVVGTVFIFPFLLTIIQPQARQRLVVQSLFSYKRSDVDTMAIANEDHIASSSAQFKLFHSQTEQWLRAIVEREINYVTPAYLFVTGDTSPRHHAPGIANGYWPDIVFYVLGFFVLAKTQFKRKGVLFLWLFLAPIPAVLSRDSTQALRSLQLVFAVDTIIALGMWYFIKTFSKLKLGIGILLIVALVYVYNFLFYLDAYYIHMPKRTSEYWLTGYKEAVLAISNEYKNVANVVFTTDYNEPYIYVLFYLGIDPKQFQAQAHLSNTRGVDVGEVEQFGTFHFRHIYWPNDRSKPNTLYVGTEEELPEKDLVSEPRASLLKTIYFADGKTAFKIVKTK